MLRCFTLFLLVFYVINNTHSISCHKTINDDSEIIKKTVEYNNNAFQYFKNYYVDDIKLNNATEADIQDAFYTSYCYDKFDIKFKVDLYLDYFNKIQINNIKFNKKELEALVVFCMKYDVYNIDKYMYKNNYEYLSQNLKSILTEALTEYKKIVHVKTREEMIEKEKIDKENIFNYMPKECHELIQSKIEHRK